MTNNNHMHPNQKDPYQQNSGPPTPQPHMSPSRSSSREQNHPPQPQHPAPAGPPRSPGAPPKPQQQQQPPPQQSGQAYPAEQQRLSHEQVRYYKFLWYNMQYMYFKKKYTLFDTLRCDVLHFEFSHDATLRLAAALQNLFLAVSLSIYFQFQHQDIGEMERIVIPIKIP